MGVDRIAAAKKKAAASFFIFLQIDDSRKPPEVRNQDATTSGNRSVFGVKPVEHNGVGFDVMVAGGINQPNRIHYTDTIQGAATGDCRVKGGAGRSGEAD